MQFIRRAALHYGQYAVVSEGKFYSYGDLSNRCESIAYRLMDGLEDLYEAPICFMVRPSFDYVATQWGIWRAGGVAVPLCLDYPQPELEYVVENTGAAAIICEAGYAEQLRPITEKYAIELLILSEIPDLMESQVFPEISPERRAMILFTSGTTSKPKGVVSTHANLAAQVEALVKAWEWTDMDHILEVLPLHHTHGILNVVCCAMWVGATCEFLPKFDAAEVWKRFVDTPANLFMAVPTIYKKLIDHYERGTNAEKEAWSAACARFRLMVSGSAALPVSVLEQWETLSGHRLLERYGMTEIGMGLSNPYESERRPGHVGMPLPEVQIRLVDEEGKIVEEEGSPGEIQVKGPNVFAGYWKRPEATAEAFTEDGWFKTGDISQINQGYYQILGRASVDIIKSGGYKISALEIEEVMRRHEAIQACAVVGIPDEEWGECVSVAIVPHPEKTIESSDLKQWMLSRIAPYKVPRQYLYVDELPRNAMGKVMKPRVKELFT